MPLFRFTTQLAMLVWLLSICGCGDGNTPSKLDPNATVVREVTVMGFDPDAEPVIREMSDGSLAIQFEAMPPFFADDNPDVFDIDNFRSRLEVAAGTDAVWDDREVFVVPDPNDESFSSIADFLGNFRSRSGG